MTKNPGLGTWSQSIIYDDSDEAFLLSLINSEAVKKNIIMSRIFLRAFFMHHLDCCIVKVPQINIIQMQKKINVMFTFLRLREKKTKILFFPKLNIRYLYLRFALYFRDGRCMHGRIKMGKYSKASV